MKLLRRKKSREVETDEDDEIEEVKKTKKPKKEIEEPKKKIPPKPWGRRERYILLAFICVTLLPSIILALTSRSWKLPGLPRIKFPDVGDLSINFLSEETIVIEGDSGNKIISENALKDIQQISKNLTGVYGVYIVKLDDGYEYGINQQENFEPASLNKLPIMYTAYALANNGQLDLSQKYVLKSSDKVSGSGLLVNSPDGEVYTYQELLDLMGKSSDNTAYKVMRSIVGEAAISQTISDLSLEYTSLKENTTTPEDVGKIFRSINRGDLLNDKFQKLFLESLTDTDFESWMAEGIPTGIKVSHKFGRETNVLNDAGIVFTSTPYVLVIMSKGIKAEEANTAIVEISESVYEAHTNSKS